MPEQTEKQKKKSSLEDKIEVIYEILGLHKLDIESMEDKLDKLEVMVKKVKIVLEHQLNLNYSAE